MALIQTMPALFAKLAGATASPRAHVMQRHNRTLWRIARGILGMTAKPKRQCRIPGFAPSPARMRIAATRASVPGSPAS